MKIKKRQRGVRRQARLRKVEQAMIAGHTNQTELAAQLGVSQVMIHKDMQVIRERWNLDDITAIEEKRQRRIKQQEMIFNEALNAWKSSKAVKTEISYEVRVCDKCRGKKMLFDRKAEEEVVCYCCEGTGKIKVERVTERESQGDVAYLREASNASKEAARLEGVVPVKSKKTLINVDAENGEITIDQTVYESLPAEELLDVLSYLDKKKQEARERLKSRGKVLEPEYKRIENREGENDVCRFRS